MGLTLAALIPPVSALADIREPTLAELSHDATAIVVVHVQATLPAPFSLPGVLSMSFLLSLAVFLWHRRDGRKLRALLAATGAGVAAALVGACLAGSVLGAHRSVALGKVERSLKGSAEGTIAVLFDSNFACDTSALSAGEDYVLFLEDVGGTAHRLSWWQSSVWHLTPRGVLGGCRDLGGKDPLPADEFLREVAKLAATR